MTTRRHIICAISAATLALALNRTASAQPARLEESESLAVSLSYKHDASKVDAKKLTAYVAGRNCANCQLLGYLRRRGRQVGKWQGLVRGLGEESLILKNDSA